MLCGSMAQWLAHLEFDQGTRVRFPTRATIPLDSNLDQVVYLVSQLSFSAPRNWCTKREFSAPKCLW